MTFLVTLIHQLKPAAKPAPAPAKPSYSAAKPASAGARNPPKHVDNDLDDLLSEVSAPKPQPPPAQSLSDIDDLLADIDAPKKPAVYSAKATPAPKPAPAPAPAPTKPAGKHAPKNSSMDDIDDLLADIGGPPARGPANSSGSRPPPPPAGKKQDLDDIDDLLDGISISDTNNKQSSNTGDIDDLLADIDAPPKGRPQSTYNASASTDDIDDLLDGLGGGGNNDPGMAAIDDLLADLNG